MIDDDDAKVRRNLVVLSSAILAWALFGFSIADFESQGWARRVQGSPISLWFVALAVLMYLWSRYRWSKEGVEKANTWSTAYVSELKLTLDRSISREAKKAKSAASRSGMSIVDPQLLTEYEAKHNVNLGKDDDIRWSFRIGEFERNLKQVDVYGNFSVPTQIPPNKRYSPADELRTQIAIPSVLAIGCKTMSWVRASSYSEHSAVALIPRLLFVIALFVTLVNLGNASWSWIGSKSGGSTTVAAMVRTPSASSPEKIQINAKASPRAREVGPRDE